MAREGEREGRTGLMMRSEHGRSVGFKGATASADHLLVQSSSYILPTLHPIPVQSNPSPFRHFLPLCHHTSFRFVARISSIITLHHCSLYLGTSYLNSGLLSPVSSYNIMMMMLPSLYHFLRITRAFSVSGGRKEEEEEETDIERYG